MSRVTIDITISLDGFVAGPNQSVENPIGENGDRLHRWMFEAAAKTLQSSRRSPRPAPTSWAAICSGQCETSGCSATTARSSGTDGGDPIPRTMRPCSYSRIIRARRWS